MSLMTLLVIRSRRVAARFFAAGRGTVVALALGAALLSPRPDQSALAAPPGGQATPLDHKDRQAIRKSVYDGPARYAHPIEDGLPAREVLVVPLDLEELYKKNPVETLSLLRKIVEGGRPRDAQVAAGYAIALGDDPNFAVGFSRWHGEDFDSYDEKRKDTPRESHLWHVDRVIDRLKK